MGEIERMIKEWNGVDTQQFIEAIEQYVTKARIEELEKASEYWTHDCASWCDGRISQLKKGLNNG